MIVERPTLDPYVDVILRLLSLASVFVGFGEGVCAFEVSKSRIIEAIRCIKIIFMRA